MRDESRRLRLSPPFACGLLTVLFLLPILGHEVFGRSGDALCASRADNDRGNCRRVRQGLPIGKLTRETIGTMEGLGGKVLRTIQGDEPLLVQHAEGVEQALRLQVGKDLEKDGGERGWCNGSEERADVLVARDRLAAEERLRVIMALTVAELALVLQKRRRLHKKKAKGSSGSVLYRVTGIGARFAHVGKVRGVLRQNRLEMIEA
jgi:hypothetical protein